MTMYLIFLFLHCSVECPTLVPNSVMLHLDTLVCYLTKNYPEHYQFQTHSCLQQTWYLFLSTSVKFPGFLLLLSILGCFVLKNIKAWIFYVDLQHLHLSNDSVIQRKAASNHKLVQDTMARWLDYKIFRGKPYRRQTTMENLVLKHNFGTVAEGF